MLQVGLLQSLATLLRRDPHLPGVQRSMLGFCSADPAALTWLLQVPGMCDHLQSSSGQVLIPLEYTMHQVIPGLFDSCKAAQITIP